MRFVLDVHCHTVASGHAYSTITENAVHAASVGLTHVGIADHGPAMPDAPHFYYFGNIQVVPDVIHGIRIVKGAEVNILDADGKVDLLDDLMKRLDFIIASLHRGVFPPSNEETHTRAILAAMENPYIGIIGHPADAFFPIDCEAVVKAAARTHTVIEINNQTLNPTFVRYSGNKPQQQILALCKEYDVPVLASSDSHYHTRVGEMTWAKALILESGIAPALVLNADPALFYAAIAKKRAVMGVQP
jgi:putative hydrolase